MGFSFFNEKTRNPFNLRFKIMIDEVEICEKELRMDLSSYPDPEDPQTLLIDFIKVGFNYFDVKQNNKIDIMINSWRDDFSRASFAYGTTDSNSNPVNAKNEDDFTVEKS